MRRLRQQGLTKNFLNHKKNSVLGLRTPRTSTRFLTWITGIIDKHFGVVIYISLFLMKESHLFNILLESRSRWR